MLRVLALLTSLALVVLFALFNWTVFSNETPLWLGFTTVQAPLGIIMLAVVGALSVLFTVWAISLQVQALREVRRHTKEMVAQRELADKAEASRFTELRQMLRVEFDQLSLAHDQLRSAVVDQIDESGNTVAAHLGELEDRLEAAKVLPRG
jgi:uncharacterized integral membrane protein